MNENWLSHRDRQPSLLHTTTHQQATRKCKTEPLRTRISWTISLSALANALQWDSVFATSCFGFLFILIEKFRRVVVFCSVHCTLIETPAKWINIGCRRTCNCGLGIERVGKTTWYSHTHTRTTHLYDFKFMLTFRHHIYRQHEQGNYCKMVSLVNANANREGTIARKKTRNDIYDTFHFIIASVDTTHPLPYSGIMRFYFPMRLDAACTKNFSRIFHL